MRMFIAACFAAGAVAFGAAFILDTSVQKESSAAFAESSVRLQR